MFVAEHFLSDIVDKYGQYPISTYGGIWYPPQARRFLKLNHNFILLMRKALLKEQFNI
ncbi:MAG TPA: hypothetical protein VN704_10930 [Verrucomicrobiae bacterium]|nr:hypothetical protein [Verrucomicrobiae bacterium]